MRLLHLLQIISLVLKFIKPQGRDGDLNNIIR